MTSLPGSLWTRRSVLEQKRLHSSSGCRSSRPGWARHPLRVNQQRRHRRAAGYTSRAANKFSRGSFHSVFLCTEHLPVVEPTVEGKLLQTFSKAGEATYLDAQFFVRALLDDISFLTIDSFHLTEAVCCVTNSTGKDSIL